MEHRLHLVDASVFVFRAWFSIPDAVADGDGRPAHAVFGFGNFLCDLLERERPRRLAVAFDQRLGSCVRNELYAPYKANRPPALADLERQLRLCRELTRIRRDVPMPWGPDALDRPPLEPAAADAVALPVQLRSRLRRMAEQGV